MVRIWLCNNKITIVELCASDGGGKGGGDSGGGGIGGGGDGGGYNG